MLFLVQGKKLAKIKEFTNNSQACTSCKSFDLRIKIFRKYQHVYMIPVYPVGDNVVEIRCKQCDEPILQESLKKEYVNKARAPFYLYSLFILFGLSGDFSCGCRVWLFASGHFFGVGLPRLCFFN